jgi:hypothetical protein
MFLYSQLDTTSNSSPATSPAYPRRDPAPEVDASGSLSFVVDLDDMGLHGAYHAHEVHRGSQCPIFARVGPEYVNPHSGAREQASWIL